MQHPSDQEIVIAAKLLGGKKLTPTEIALLQLRREREQCERSKAPVPPPAVANG